MMQCPSFRMYLQNQLLIMHYPFLKVSYQVSFLDLIYCLRLLEKTYLIFCLKRQAPIPTLHRVCLLVIYADLHRLSISEKEKLLENLIKYPYDDKNLAYIIPMFSHDLFKFSEYTRERIANIFPNYLNIIQIPTDYNELPDSIKGKIIDKWIIDIEQNKNEKVIGPILNSIRNNYNKLPKPIVDRILETILDRIENKIMTIDLLSHIIPIYYNLSKSNRRKVISILTRYLDQNQRIDGLTLSHKLQMNINLFPRSLQVKLIKGMYNVESLDYLNLYSMFDNYKLIPEVIKISLIDTMIERTEGISFFITHYNQLPKFCKDKLIRVISNNERIAIDSFDPLLFNYDSLPKILKEQLIKIIRNNKLRGNDKYWIGEHFSEISDPIRDKLLEIMQNDIELTRSDTGIFPYTNLDKLPELLREKLIKILIQHLENDKSIATDICFIFKDYLQRQTPQGEKLFGLFLRCLDSDHFIAEKIAFHLALGIVKIPQPYKERFIEPFLKVR